MPAGAGCFFLQNRLAGDSFGMYIGFTAGTETVALVKEAKRVVFSFLDAPPPPPPLPPPPPPCVLF